MTRPLRLAFPPAVYHLTGRGNARQRIVRDDEDRRRFLTTLAHVIDRSGWLCHADCVMDHHYHRLIETPRPTLSRGMRQLHGVYTQAFNRRHHLKAILVEQEPHLLELCRDVGLNPVRANLVAPPPAVGLEQLSGDGRRDDPTNVVDDGMGLVAGWFPCWSRSAARSGFCGRASRSWASVGSPAGTDLMGL